MRASLLLVYSFAFISGCGSPEYEDIIATLKNARSEEYFRLKRTVIRDYKSEISTNYNNGKCSWLEATLYHQLHSKRSYLCFLECYDFYIKNNRFLKYAESMIPKDYLHRDFEELHDGNGNSLLEDIRGHRRSLKMALELVYVASKNLEQVHIGVREDILPPIKFEGINSDKEWVYFLIEALFNRRGLSYIMKYRSMRAILCPLIRRNRGFSIILLEDLLESQVSWERGAGVYGVCSQIAGNTNVGNFPILLDYAREGNPVYLGIIQRSSEYFRWKYISEYILKLYFTSNSEEGERILIDLARISPKLANAAREEIEK